MKTRTRKGIKPNINPKNKLMIKKAMDGILKENTLKVMNESVDFTVALTQISLAIILNDKYNWEKESIQKIMKQMEELNSNILEHRVSTYDIITVFRDELGFEVPSIIQTFMDENFISESESI